MGANMRRIVLLCFAFSLVMLAPAAAQFFKRSDDTAATAAKQPAKKQGRAKASPEAEAKKDAPDPRPILKRADDMAPVATPAPQEPAAKKVRSRPKPADAAAASARAKPQDAAACGQVQVPDAAIAGCTKIIEDQKQKPKGRAAAYYNRGNAHAAKGDHDAAIADFDEALKLEPKNASAYNNRGNARNDKGESDAALDDFGAAIKQNARYASAYFNRANLLAAKGDTAAALKDYDTALRYNRRNVNAYIARGALLLAGGASAKARADMRQAAALDRKNAYTVLWHDIAERRAKQKGVLMGRKGSTNGLDLKAWPGPVIQLFAGELKHDAMLAAADDPNPAVKAAHTCEANFYGGEHALIDGNRDEAVKLFGLAVKECPRGFLEGIAASAELKGLGEKVAN
jgi:lipoprotein NlpI